MNLKTVTIADLKPHPDNPNTHPTKQIQALVKSLDKFTQVKNVVIWRGMMLAGHAIREAGIKSGRLTLEAVDVSHWDEDKAKAFMLADIRLPDMGIYDEAAMAEALRHIDEPLDIPGFDEEFLREMGLGERGPKEEEPIEPGAAEKAQEIWGVKLGDVWQLGRHKIACINSFDEEAVKILIDKDVVGMVWADPPYGMNLNTDWSNAKSALKMFDGKGIKGGRKYTPVEGDDFDFDPQRISLLSSSEIKEVFLWGADYYAERIKDKNIGSWLVWDKRLDESADKMYGSCFELCWSKCRHKRDIIRIKWAGVFGVEQEPDRQRFHPTQKPAALFEWVANKYFKEGGVVFDPFLGSGMSIIGSENIGDSISVIGCELSPEYISVICQRFLDHTSIKPELIK